MKILVVEDNRAVAHSLQLLLSNYNYSVDIAADGEEALQLADAFEYHLVLLDVLLPRLSGIEVCRQLRKRGFRQPILLLTGQGETQQKAIALNLGADDYVVKPFDNDELVARIQALLRRGGTVGDPILNWGHLSLDPNTRKVAYRDQILVLTPKEYAILELFLRHPEMVFSAKVILDQAWSSLESPGEEAVRCHIKDLRRKLTTVGAPKDLIKTAYRVGYRLNPLYAASTPVQVEQSLTAPQVAELRSVNEELRVAMEQLQSIQTELQQRNQELQAAHDELEQRVADRTKELQVLYDQAPCGYHSLDAEGRIVQINETELRMFGYAREEMLGRKITDFYTPEGLQTFQENYPKFIQQGWVNDLEFTIIRKNGSRLPISLSATAIRDDAGNFLMSRSIVIDISDRVHVEAERKQAELSLQKQIQQEYLLNDIAQEIRRSLNLNDVLSSTVHRVRAFLEVDRVIIFRFRPDWQGEVIMESVGDGWTPIFSTTIFDPCFHDHYIEPYRQGRVATLSDIDTADLEPCYAELLQQFQVKANLVVPILQNNHLWGLLIAHHCTAPRQWTPAEIAFLQRLATQVGIAIQQAELYQQLERELNDRQQAEAALRESRQQLQLILDHSPTVIYLIDSQNRHLLVNRSYANLLATTPENLVGKSIYEVWASEVADEVAAHNRTVLETNQLLQIEEVVPHLDGKPHTYLTVKFPLWDDAGTPYAVCGISTDITEKKNLETQFYQAQRLESLGTLTSGIAHDLNNTLTPILTIAQLLRMQPPELKARSQEMLQLLEESAQRGANMVKQILTFTRGTGGERSLVDVALLLQEVVKVAQQTFPKFITIRAIVPAQGIRQVSADATQLHQVLMNLCVNARDAMLTGGTLTLSVENFDANEIFAQMNLDAHVGQYILITVTDTGTGIAPEVRDRIFDPFFTTKAIGQGTGLGLSTVLGIVRSYGGCLQVASEVGKGTQFKIYLPAVEAEAASHRQETALPQGQGELILVVDEESPILQSTRAILETHHYQVLTATNGTEAIALYAQHQQDIALVLVDMMMPDMDGVTVIRVLQEMNPQVRAIAVSGLLPQYQNSLESLGIKIHLNKPYTTEDLLNSIHLQ